MKMNIEGKVFNVLGFGGNNELTDTILVSFGFSKSPSVETMEEDDGKTPIHSMKLVDTISENVLKENMTLSDMVRFNEDAFFCGLTYRRISQITKLECRELFDIADKIEFTPSAAKATIKELCFKQDAIDDIFEYLIANYVAAFAVTGVDKFVCDVAKKDTATITLIRGDKVVAEVNLGDSTVTGKEAEAVAGFFVGQEGKSITLAKGNSAIVSVPKETKPEKTKPAEKAKEIKPVVEEEKETKPVVSKEGDTTVITNPTENIVLADTVQGAVRIDLKKLYRYVAEGSLRHVPYEDKADVMIRLEAAIKSLEKDPENIKKYFSKAPKVKYGFMKTQYKNKGTFMLTNGDRYWKFGLLTNGEYVFNFFTDVKEADAFPVEANPVPSTQGVKQTFNKETKQWEAVSA